MRFVDQLDGDQYDLFVDHIGGVSRKKRKKGKKPSSSPAWYYLGFLGEIGFSISLPIAGGALFGAYLDDIWGTYPKATLALLLTGVVISMINFIKIIRSFTRK